jgi:hypothetical protein
MPNIKSRVEKLETEAGLLGRTIWLHRPEADALANPE